MQEVSVRFRISSTVFDNCGSSNGKSRVCRYWIDEKSLSIQNFKEYKSKIAWSPFMGGAQPVDIENEVFELAYGGSFPYIGFEEYDFKNRKQNMKLVFEDGYDIYQVFAGEVKVNDPLQCST